MEMRGAGMSLKGAASGLVIFLLSVSVVQGQHGWGVTYTSTQICAFKGSTVEIHCIYTYPSTINDYDTTVKETFWFTNKAPVDLKTDSDYKGRVEYHFHENVCTLRITDLRESDSAEYKFRFITNQQGGKYTGSPGVTLSVTDLQVQVSRSEIYQSSYWAELKCHSSCPGQPDYIWYKNGQKIWGPTSSSYSGSFYPADSVSCAVHGYEKFPSPPVYALRVASVSVSPSGEIVEGSSVTLSCSSDANPAATYRWYKRNGNQHFQYLSRGPQFVFRSIQSSDSGEYYCTAENELGTSTTKYVSINVKYAPKLPSVSVSPSGEIVEGGSVNLTCSSDANPAAKYTWYKEDEDSPKSSGQIFTITDIRAEHSGNYYCEAQNRRGRHNSTLHLTVVSGNSTIIMDIIRLTLVVLMLIPLLLLNLWTRKKKTLSSTPEPHKPVETIELDSCPAYETISDLKAVTAAQTEDTEEQEDMM